MACWMTLSCTVGIPNHAGGGCLQSELSQRLGELKELVDGYPEKKAI